MLARALLLQAGSKEKVGWVNEKVAVCACQGQSRTQKTSSLVLPVKHRFRSSCSVVLKMAGAQVLPLLLQDYTVVSLLPPQLHTVVHLVSALVCDF